jgi:hypothetical protein
MAIVTQTITTDGDQTVFSYAGGSGAAIVTGTFNQGSLQLLFSLDDTNYAPIGGESLLEHDGGFAINNIPACSMRWRVKTASGQSAPSVIASVQEA